VPSLALLQQTLKVWTREYLIAGIKPDWLCVCSDQTVSDDQDDFVSNIYELGIDVTTDKNEIKKFLKSKANTKIVFTTYQSGKVTAQGAKGFTFDLGIMDEAHKTVGLGSKPMAHLIHQKNIKIKHRLFMTATERLFRGDKEEYLSMDDPRDYGDLIYQLSFKEAIEAKPPIIADYKIITFGISQPDIEAIYNDNKFIQIKKDINDIKAREFATALALRKAIKKLGIKNAISFHSSIKRANNFKIQQELISKVYPEYGNLKAFHVSGDMPTNQRSSQMREFAESKGLMTNSRCLTEGVDLPAIDCVVFTDPKKSKVDIVQAAGRALRLSPGKKFGYILIPLIIPENENATEVAKDTAFEEIVATIRALATQDSRIIEYLRAVSSGSIPKGGSPVDGITKINVLTKVNEEEFNKSIQLKVWDRVAFGNWRPYEEAKKYVQALKINKIHDWWKIRKLPNFPNDIPSQPQITYKKSGTNWVDFIGSSTRWKGGWIEYDDAKNIVRANKIKNKIDYKKFRKQKKYIYILAGRPELVYKNSGWTSWYDFLGEGYISTAKRKYLTYQENQNFWINKKIKTRGQFWKYFKNNEVPAGVAKSPDAVFKNQWKGWGDYLKTGNLSNSVKQFKSYVETLKIVRKNNIKTRDEYIKFVNKHPELILRKSLKQFPQYKDADDFFDRKFITFKEAKKIAKEANIYNISTWKKFARGKTNLPVDIKKFCKNNNIFNIKNFFHNYSHSEPKKYFSYREAKKKIKKLNLKNIVDFRNLSKKNLLNKKIPKVPNDFYKNKGWNGWGDFLGTGNLSPKIKYQLYLSFENAKKLIKKNNITTAKEYINFKSFNKNSFYLPSSPATIYKKSWKGWNDFIDKKSFFTYYEAKKLLKKNKVKSLKDYNKFIKTNKDLQKILPKTPDGVYLKTGDWKNWSDFLNIEDFYEFEEAKKIINKFKFSSQYQMIKEFNFKKYTRMPKAPSGFYRTRNKWKGWPDFLGTGTKPRSKKNK
jgi:superfamily II DNA or RNA helicase